MAKIILPSATRPAKIQPWSKTLNPLHVGYVEHEMLDIAVHAVVIEPDERFHGDIALTVCARSSTEDHWRVPVQHAMVAWRLLAQTKLAALVGTDLEDFAKIAPSWTDSLAYVTKPMSVSPPVMVRRDDTLMVRYHAPDGSVNMTKEGPVLAVTLYGMSGRSIQ